jgi:hypothetical protein
MIKTIEAMTLLEKLTVIAEGFGKIAYNFWPVLLLGALVCFGIARQEARSTRR